MQTANGKIPPTSFIEDSTTLQPLEMTSIVGGNTNYDLLSSPRKSRIIRILHSCVGCIFPKNNHKQEAYGLALDIFTRATIGMSSVYMGPALLELATAECFGDVDTNTSAETTTDDPCFIHGFRPSSLLTNLAAVSGLLGSVVLPLFGAMMDHTPHRKSVGYGTAVAIAIIKGVEIGVGPRTWLGVVALQVLSAIVYNLHLTATIAYIPELSQDTTHQAAYNSAFGMILFVSTLIFLVHVMMWSLYFDTDDVGTARISQVLTTITAILGFGVAWKWLFPHRPALRLLQSHESLWTVGFTKTWQTVRTVSPTALAVLGVISLGEAASSGLVSVSTTYCKVWLQMDGNEIGLVFLLVLIGGIPGTKLGEFVTNYFGNPLHSLAVCFSCFIVTTTGAALILRGPEDKTAAYIVGVLWGITLGWISPQNTCAFVPFIPSDQSTEWMGLFVLATQVFTWFPPLLFSFLNERGWAMPVGLASLNLVFIGALMLVWVANGDAAYKNAEQQKEPVETTVGDPCPPIV